MATTVIQEFLSGIIILYKETLALNFKEAYLYMTVQLFHGRNFSKLGEGLRFL